jgi:hypothetical protein
MDGSDLESRVSRLESTLSRFSADLRLALQYVRSDAASSLTKSRLIMEKLLERVYATEMGREPRKPLLGEMLADNQFTRKIERRILARMNAIRDMGNLGPHGENVHPGDAVRVLDDLCEVLDWYIIRYAEGPRELPGTEPEIALGPGTATGASSGEQKPGTEPDIELAPATPRGVASREQEEEALRELNRELLLADSHWALKEWLYKVNVYLKHHPDSVKGQLLRDRVTRALRNVPEATGEFRPPPPPAAMPASSPARRLLGCVFLLVVACLAAALAILLVR